MEYFDRQVTIEGWNQEEIENSVCLCFGAGGLGSVVAINLCRLGVGRIIIMDCDYVDASNLNRQLTFSKRDLGQSKALAAKANLEENHNLNSDIEAYHIDIVKNWGEVLQVIRKPSVLFNMIDYGDYFDMAAQSLALSLGVPLVQGGTYSQHINVEFTRPHGRPCLCCSFDEGAEILRQVTPEKIQSLNSLEFLPKANNMTGKSNSYLCGTCGMLMTAKYSESLISSDLVSNRTLFYVNSMESENFSIEPKPDCLLCG